MNSSAARVTALLALALAAHCAAAAEVEDVVARVKRSVVAVGTFERTRVPPFRFLGTGFVVADGTIVATNDHVASADIDTARGESLAILAAAVDPQPSGKQATLVRAARVVRRSPEHDLALLRIDGQPMPAIAVGDSNGVREGRGVYFTGFPIGAVLGPYPATHRATIAAITPIAIPQGRAGQLSAATARRLAAKPFPVFQLDGTAYPGNSGSPVYEATDGAVIGIVNMVLVKATKETLLSQPSGIAYAVPAEHLRSLLHGVR
jgi:S1-C subfamily serine protease